MARGKDFRLALLIWWKAFNTKWKPSHFLLYFFLGFWAIQANPLGLSSASDKALSEELSRLRAYFNPVAAAPITVVGVDYDSIRALHDKGDGWMEANDWPLTYNDHRNILGTLLKPRNGQAPTAVFYDIFFERPRVTSGDMDYFGRTLTRMQARHGVPVFLAGGGSYMPMSDESYRALGQPSLAVSAKEGYGDYYPLHARLRDAAMDTPVPEYGPAAATALYVELCKQQGDDCAWAEKRDAMPLALQWEVLDRAECSMLGSASRVSRIVSGIGSILARMVGVSDVVDIAPATCLPFHQVRLADLFADPAVSLKPPHLAPGDPYVVLVGVVMKSMNDYHATPVYGQASGVYVHATAVENLVRLGDGYIRHYDVRAIVITAWGMLLLAFWICLKAPMKRHKAPPAGERSRYKSSRIVQRLSWQLLWWGLFVLAVVGLYGVFYIHYDIAPEGWLSLIALVPLLRQVVIQAENKFDDATESQDDRKDVFTMDDAVLPDVGTARPGQAGEDR